MRIGNISYFFFYFLILSITALFILPVSFVNFTFYLNDSLLHFNTTCLEVRQHFGFSDPGSFALGGWTLFTKGWFDAETLWLINLWPPGFMILESIILKVFGANAPLVGILQILAACAIAIFFTAFRSCLQLVTKPIFATFIPLLLLLSTQLRFFMLGPDAVLYGETFAISFVFIGFFCLILANANNKPILAVVAGTGFALSAYFRSQFEILFVVATLLLIGLALVIPIYNWFKLSQHKKINRIFIFDKLSPLAAILIALITFHVLTAPYRIYNYHRTHAFRWVQTGDIIWLHNFTSSAALEKNMGAFVVSGAGNTACLVDPIMCAKIEKKIASYSSSTHELRQLTILTLLKNPFIWIYYKLKALPVFWFISPLNYTNLLFGAKIPAIAENTFNYIFICCFIFVIFFLITKPKDSQWLIALWLTVSIISTYIIIFLFAHYETRYFFLFKFYFYALTLLFIAEKFKYNRIQQEY